LEDSLHDTTERFSEQHLLLQTHYEYVPLLHPNQYFLKKNEMDLSGQHIQNQDDNDSVMAEFVS